ncbi:uncharacterized protein LOC120259557 [Dioscorea cayenensis subsp. rotundata]|uniref:Uncharacterized protein LOC120259557 n=1 Tax=Dioscorea cayennensis subsp. rotundata TaxID=55577 RepID=A0AB40B742_DIOCR|nr:uncharacterized protein LOC120259557 [Dioscorea cayenensis subsp. rotundata]
MAGLGASVRLPLVCSRVEPPFHSVGAGRTAVIHSHANRTPLALVLALRGCPSVIRCTIGPDPVLRTCKNCKQPFDPSVNHPRACRFHTAHFGGETKRKFESVYTGGTMNTPDSGQVFQYWHCCGSEDPFDAGCTAAPHCSYDD